MGSHVLGFKSSWEMLTRDKGWIKPVMVLAIVGIIPVVGQIALLGYGLEWARLTAWGVDSAPKQSNVQVGKIMRTGGIAFLVGFSMAVILAIIETMAFGSGNVLLAFPGTAGFAELFNRSTSVAAAPSSFVSTVVSLPIGTFFSIAMMRATIYDGFVAGWRVDRLGQMIGRDPKGFVQLCVVSILTGLVNWVYGVLLGVVMSVMLLGSFIGVVSASAMAGSVEGVQGIVMAFLQMGPATALVFLIVIIALAFVGACVGIAMELVSINAVGQWFCRFDLARWGESADPLPDGVPLDFGQGASGWNAPAPTNPARDQRAVVAAPAADASEPAGASEPAAEPTVEPAAPETSPSPAEAPAETDAGESAPSEEAAQDTAGEPHEDSPFS